MAPRLSLAPTPKLAPLAAEMRRGMERARAATVAGTGQIVAVAAGLGSRMAGAVNTGALDSAGAEMMRGMANGISANSA